MAKVKVKRKSTLIDMTAMSDVTVLLLTFFMLTSTFVQQEPVQTITPASVSEFEIPEQDVLKILIEPSGKVFLGLDNFNDRAAALDEMLKVHTDVQLTDEQKNTLPEGSIRIFKTSCSGISNSDTEAGVIVCTGSC